MRLHFGGHSARDEHLAVAGLYIHLHDGARLYRCFRRLSTWFLDSNVGTDSTMGWQLFFTVLIVAAAAAYLVRRAWRLWASRQASCGGGCLCTHARDAQAISRQGTTFIPAENITLRRPV